MSYRTLHKIFELLYLRRVQTETTAQRVAAGKKMSKRKRGTTNNSLVEGNKDAADSGVEAEAPVDPQPEEEEKEGILEGPVEDDDEEEVRPFSSSVEVSMLEIYNEQVIMFKIDLLAMRRTVYLINIVIEFKGLISNEFHVILIIML